MKKPSRRFILLAFVLLFFVLALFWVPIQNSLSQFSDNTSPPSDSPGSPSEDTPDIPDETPGGEPYRTPVICGYFRGSGSLPTRDQDTVTYDGSCGCDLAYITVERSISFPSGYEECTGYASWNLIFGGASIWSKTDYSSVNTFGSYDTVTYTGDYCRLYMTIGNHFGCSIDYSFLVTFYGYPT